jgi:hypothetical protein
MNEGDREQAELQPGEWREWRAFVGRIDDAEQSARVAAYIAEHFEPPPAPQSAAR